MEPDRYWFLYFGLLFLFLSSKTGNMVCFVILDFLRTGFFLTVALLAAIAAKLCWAVSVILFRFAVFWKEKREGRTEADA